MKHLIMGTAGHIDHGKTALVQALTGVDCDTHKEEKERGITIHLGFTHMKLPSGEMIGIVDVPGHADFVHTMVGGASGIDFALLVVAADSGIMPQTREHLQIMDILGIKKGLVAITRIDLVDQDILEMTEEEVKELISGTFLGGCPVVKVSSKTSEGIDELRECISRVAAGVENRPRGEFFKLFIDRIFTVKGFGTVVTGSVISGTLHPGDEACLLPGGKKLRVRRIERYGEETEEVTAGDRAAINLAGLDREDYRRGMVLSDTVLPHTTMIDAKLNLFCHTTSFHVWTKVIFHLGTYEHQARVHLIDCDRLTGGNSALVQILLDFPCVIQQGERFVIRNTSNNMTLGGGTVIDAFPLHHRKRPEKLVKSMNRRATGNLPELIASEVIKRYTTVTHLEIAHILNVSPDKVYEAVSGPTTEDIAAYDHENIVYLIIKKEHDRIQDQLLKSIEHHHRRHPLTKGGRTTRELMGILRIDPGSSSEILAKILVEQLEKEGKIENYKGTWILSGYSIRIGEDLQKKINFVENFLKSSGMKTPLLSELKPLAKNRGIDEQLLNQILAYLAENRNVYFVDDNYLHTRVVDKCRQLLLSTLARKKEGLTVAEFRDLVKGNRKICLLLLNIYDTEGVTERVGDTRVITEKGIAAVK